MSRLQQILASKAAYRRQLAQRPVAEKLRLVEELAARTRAIRHRPPRPLPAESSPASSVETAPRT